MCKKSELRLVKRIKNECGCASLQDLCLLAVQMESVPRGLNISDEIRKLRDLETGNAMPSYEFPSFLLAFVDKVRRKEKPAQFFKSVWKATQSSGRVMTT